MTTPDPAPALAERRQLFIGGRWEDSDGGEAMEVRNPADQSVIGHATLASARDLDRAARSARESFDDGRWRDQTGAERAAVMRRAADLLEERSEDIARVLTAELGCPMWFSRQAHVPNPIKHTRYYAGLAENYELDEVRTDESGLRSLVTQEPVGVVGAITPWNGPLSSPSLKIMPALAAGCSVVLKPPPQTPLTAYALADAFREAGLPEGVLSILPAGRDAGRALIEHPEVDKIAFTGSTMAGRAMMHAAAERIARVTLELGGRSAAIVLDDAVVEHLVATVLPMALMVNGQLCIAQTRLLVPRRREKEITDALAAALESWTVGDPMDTATKIGPLVSRDHLERVTGYLDLARSEGANLVSASGGSLSLPSGHEAGNYLVPTLLTGVDNSMRAVREEIFGPVIAVVPYDSEDEAVSIANDSPYGLSGSIWGSDEDHAVAVARRIQTGMLSINGAPQAYGAPFGGFKQSGIGREMGPEGYRSYLETKSIALGSSR